jgi:hypothetical protein
MKRRRTWFNRFSFDSGLLAPRRPFGVPFAAFADGGGGSGAGAGEGGTQGDSGGNGDTGGQAAGTGAAGTAAEVNGQQTAQTFTQEQVTAMMAKEKDQGRKSALKELGITDPAQAKAILEAATKLGDATKPAGQKLDEKDQTIQTERAGREAAEQKLELVLAKAKPEHLDDILLLAKARMTDNVDSKAAVELVKKAMPMFFEGEGSGKSSGTGDPPGGKKGNQDGGAGYGKRAAEIAKASNGGKSSFFKQT